MYADTAAVATVAIKATLKLLELSLHLYAGLFPEQAIVKDCFKYDFIIVGAGSAGCVLARRLSDNENFNVLLIESGDNPTTEVMVPGLATFNEQTPFDWNYTSVKDSHSYQCYKEGAYRTIRGHGIGGTSGVNYMIYARGDPNDYRQWADKTKNPTWAYDNVLPYFKKGERMEDEQVLNSEFSDYHGTDGDLGINIFRKKENLKYLESLNEIGYRTVLDTNGNNTLGFNFPMMNIADGKRQSSCYCYLSPVRERKNLHVLRNTRVSKVIFRNKKAVGVECIGKDSKTFTVKSRLEVILSAGTYNSAQLLMLSGIGPKKHLKAHNIKTIVDLPVGRHMKDHAGITLLHQIEKRKSPVPSANYFGPPMELVNGFLSLNKSQSYPDAQLILTVSNNGVSIPNYYALTLGLHDDISERVYEASKNHEVLVTIILNLRPLSNGRVLLRSADPMDSPKIYLETFSNKKDLDLIIRTVKAYVRIEKTRYFRSVKARRIDLPGDRCKGFHKDSYEYWRCYSMCLMMVLHHPCGTCAMGTVVDSQLRVKGVRGLRVVDASVFPTIPSANTNAPTMMVAEKAADMIKQDYGSDE